MLHHLRTHHAVTSSAGRRVVINNRPTKREAGSVRGARGGRGAASNISGISSGSGSSSQSVPGAPATPSPIGPSPKIASAAEDSHDDGAPCALSGEEEQKASTVAANGATATDSEALSSVAAVRQHSSAETAAVPCADSSAVAVSLPESAPSPSSMAVEILPLPVPPVTPSGAGAVVSTPVPDAVAAVSLPSVPGTFVPAPVASDSKWAASPSVVRTDPALAAAVAAVACRGRSQVEARAATVGVLAAAATGRKGPPPPLLLGLPSTESDGGVSLLPLSPLTPAEQSGRGDWPAPPSMSRCAIPGTDTTAPTIAAAAVAAWNAPPMTDAVGTLMSPCVSQAFKSDADAVVAAAAAAVTPSYTEVGGSGGIGGAPPASTDWLLPGMDMELFDDNMDEVVGAASLGTLPTPSASVTDLCMGSLGIVLPVPPCGGGERIAAGVGGASLPPLPQPIVDGESSAALLDARGVVASTGIGGVVAGGDDDTSGAHALSGDLFRTSSGSMPPFDRAVAVLLSQATEEEEAAPPFFVPGALLT